MPLSDRKLAANRRNLAKAGPLTPEGRDRLRKATIRDRPWEYATGPRTAAGKATCRMNALKDGRETAGRRAWRRDALRFIRLDLELRRAMEGKAIVGNPADQMGKLVEDLARFADRVKKTRP